MSGAGDRDLYVSSWGFEEVDGVRWQRWSVSWKGERRLLLLLPPAQKSVDALVIAHWIADGEAW